MTSQDLKIKPKHCSLQLVVVAFSKEYYNGRSLQYQILKVVFSNKDPPKIRLNRSREAWSFLEKSTALHPLAAF